MGATSIERHITLDRAMYGSDQAASLEVGGLHRLVTYIREIEKSIGDGIKKVTDTERNIANKLRKVDTL
jgi:N-acetylneuraminate synthase